MPQSLILWMTTLAGYIPSYGDRIAARRFCLQHHGASTKESTKTSLLEKLKKKMAIGGNDDDTNNQETSTAKRKRSYAKHNKWAEKATRKIELGWIHKVREGKFEAFSYDILDYQEETIFDNVITVGELYSILKMGVLCFYLCTKAPEDTDDEECDGGKSDVNKDVHNDMLEKDEQPFQTAATEAILDTSEVMLGLYLGEPMAGQMDDSFIYQPGLQNDEDIIITSDLIPRTSSALSTPYTASIGDNTLSMPPPISTAFSNSDTALTDDEASSMPPPTSTANVTPESASIGEVASSSTVSYDVCCAYHHKTSQGRSSRGDDRPIQGFSTSQA